MKNVRRASCPTLAIAFAFFGCGGSSSPPTDASVERLGTGSGNADSGGAVSDASGADNGANILDSGAGDRFVVESGVRDGSADISTRTEAGPDSAFEFAGPDLAAAAPDSTSDTYLGGQDTLAVPDLVAATPDSLSDTPLGARDASVVLDLARTPDSPSGTSADGQDSAADAAHLVDAPAAGCAAGFHDGGDGACVANGTCSAGYHDNGTGVCVQASCASGYHDGGNGTCVATGSCVTGYHNGGNGTCVAVGACMTGYHDGGNGTCVPNGTCASGYHDGGNGTCVVIGACMTGYQDPGNGTCVAIGTGGAGGGGTGGAGSGGTGGAGSGGAGGSGTGTGGQGGSVILLDGGAADSAGGSPGSCTIASVLYPGGTINPDNACLGCQPSSSTNAWSIVGADGTSCDVGKVCHTGACQAGCGMAAIFYPPDAPNPDNTCQTCQPTVSTTAWSNLEGTRCDTRKVCHAGTCQFGCVIGSTFYSEDAVNPDNSCQFCNPRASVAGWSDVPPGPALRCGTGQVCHAGACQAGCCMGSSSSCTYYAPGAANPAYPNGCNSNCNPTVSITDWEKAPNGTSCYSGSVAGVCTNGVCSTAH
jgi:hypothetical protein